MTDLQNSSRESTASNRPGLYLVATPIGNLGDITLRALETLRAARVILCEDKRVTSRLLSHYDIHAPLQVYNDQSEHRDHDRVLDRIRSGDVVALVSDAGMPLLSDPGYQLVQAVRAADLYVTSIPGPSAILSALQLSGLPSDAFLFLGFLPNKSGERRERLRAVSGVAATVLVFERADRVPDLLRDMIDGMGDRRVAVVREITKLFEETRRGLASELIVNLAEHPIKGEVVVAIDRGPGGADYTDAALNGLLRSALDAATTRDAVDRVSAETGVSRKRIYDLALVLKDSNE